MQDKHGDPLHERDPDTAESATVDKMDDAEDLKCAPGSSSDIRVANPARSSAPENLVDATVGQAETRVRIAIRKKGVTRVNTGVRAEEPDLKVTIIGDCGMEIHGV